MSKYVFKPYNPIFPLLFENEKKRLSAFLTGNYRMEHIGSTAVPNLGGKGIIDMYIVAPKEDLEKISEEVILAGYEERPRVSEDTHIFLRIDLPDSIEKVRRYHVHINYPEAKDFEKTIRFRDYLRKYPEEVKRYAQIKKNAAEKANENKDKYMAIKAPIMKEILKKALLEMNQRTKNKR